jgi:hypothetical protein
VLFIAAVAVVVAPAQQGHSAIRPVRLSPNQAPALQCDDVTKLDVRNLMIRTAQRTFAFHNGIAVNYDWPPDQDTDYSKPDWKAEIEKDSVIQRAPNVVVRFLLIDDSHATGSGWRFYLSGFRCSGGKLQEIFHRDGMSLRVDRLDSTTLSVSLNVIPGEPTRKHWSYTWDRNTSQYVLLSTWSSPR